MKKGNSQSAGILYVNARVIDPEFQIRIRTGKRNRLARKKDLEAYLQDHFAGSVAALEVVDLIATHRGDHNGGFFVELRQEIHEDQEALQRILQSLEIGTAPLRNATAYFGEKLARLKVRLEDPSGTKLGRLEQIEALALGIEGKRALWNTLLAIQEDTPSLRSIDFGRLGQRADEQRKQVETRRIEWVRETFAINPSTWETASVDKKTLNHARLAKSADVFPDSRHSAVACLVCCKWFPQ